MEPLSEGWLDAVTEIALTNSLPIDISRLTAFPNLEHIRICNGKDQITDLSSMGALTNLTNLRSICIFYNQIIDISPLVSLTNLNRLYLQGKYYIKVVRRIYD